MECFLQAQPVWAKGLEREMNITCRFEGSFYLKEGEQVMLRVAAATIYRAWLNGKLAAWGPARCAHGFYRVDEWPVNDLAVPGQNTVIIEVSGYNVNCYAYLDEPSFLQAEIEADGRVLLHTGEQGGFDCLWDRTRQQRAQRFSFQRAFVEAYDFLSNDVPGMQPVSTVVTAEKKLLPRGIPLPLFPVRSADRVIAKGRMVQAKNPKPPFQDRATTQIGPKIKGFREEELDAFLTKEAGRMDYLPGIVEQCDPIEQAIGADEYILYEFSQNTTGFISVSLYTDGPCSLYLFFDERLQENDIDYLRMGCVDIVRYRLDAGTHQLLTMEPYTLKYLKVVCVGAGAKIYKTEIVEYKANLPILPNPVEADTQLKAVYDAAVETFMQNSADIFMDCPSRERAGWLCDSYFTAIGELCITGENRIEQNFLENFVLPDTFPYLPQGMFPMCYPSDHNDGNFIPNWAMWIVLQIADNRRRTGDTSWAEKFEPKVMALLEYFKGFENEDGLLEDLEGWVFIDWSRANDNDLVCGVNYPSNMLYAKMLESAGDLYRDETLVRKASELCEIIRRQSFDGCFFMDNATRQDGRLVRGTVATEACQSYAFFCGIATPELYPQLWEKFRDGFETNSTYWPCSQNAFIGLYVRLAALAALGEWNRIEKELRDIFYPQASATGTLWEQRRDISSLNHGFASYAAELVSQVVKWKARHL